MATSPISPLTFFRNASSFVSQARGKFRVSAPFSTDRLKKFTGYSPSIQNSIDRGFAALYNGLLAKSVNVPGQQLARFAANLISGPERQMPHQIMMSDLDIEFYLVGETSEKAADVYVALRAWQKYIVGPLTPPNGKYYGIQSEFIPFVVNYYDDFVSEAEVELYGPDNATNLHMKFYEVYPLNIGAIQTAWDGQDAPATLSVTFAYFYNDII